MALKISEKGSGKMNRNKTACFTGHRPNKIGGYNENHPQRQNVKRRLREQIIHAISAGFDTFISGMALGVDMDAAEIVLEFRDTEQDHVKLIAAVPFEGQERKWPAESQRKWNDIICRANDLEYVCEPGYAAWKMQKRNEWMVDNSGLVIAVWDGTSGGTGNCVNYARKAPHEPRIVQIDPTEVTA